MSKPCASDAVMLELARLATRLRHAWRAERGALRFIQAPNSGDAIEAELARLEILAGRLKDPDPEVAKIEERVHGLEERCQALRQAQPELPLYSLAHRAGLDDLALDVLLLGLSPEVEAGFGRAFHFAIRQPFRRNATYAPCSWRDGLSARRAPTQVRE